jgi:hypothetical protein
MKLLKIQSVNQFETKQPLADAQTLKRARPPPICAKYKGDLFGFQPT